MNCSAMILAGGVGSRMLSARPKPLHMMCGRPLLIYVMDALAELDPERVVVVVGPGAEKVTKKLTEVAADSRLEFIEQRVPRGSGDAVMAGLTSFLDDPLEEDLMILPCDTPLLRAKTMSEMLAHHRSTGAAATFLTSATPTGGDGRRQVVRRTKDDSVDRLVDPLDVPADEPLNGESAVGVFCIRRGLVAPALRRVLPAGDSSEIDLADVVEILREAGHRVETHAVTDPVEVLAVNDRTQLAVAETELRRRTNGYWLDRGVSMVDPANTYIDTTVRLSADVTIFPGTMLQGDTVVGEGAELGPNTRLVDCAVGAGAVVTETSGTEAEIGADAVVGPYAVLEPGAHVEAGDTTGPFCHRSE